MTKLLAIGVLLLALGVPHAHAASLLVDGSGLLTGATGVIVDGMAYDVRFEAGSCNATHAGCDPLEDFVFTSASGALAASQALLDQVFLGENLGDPALLGFYDSRPGLTHGCTLGAFLVCTTITPYAFANGINLLAGLAHNYGHASALTDYAELASMGGGGVDHSGNQTFAVWSVAPVATVPEPASLTLLGAGLIGAAIKARRRRAALRS